MGTRGDATTRDARVSHRIRRDRRSQPASTRPDSGAPRNGLVVGVPVLVTYTYVLVRLFAVPGCLVAGARPAAAVREGWRRTRGHGWTIVSLILVVASSRGCSRASHTSAHSSGRTRRTASRSPHRCRTRDDQRSGQATATVRSCIRDELRQCHPVQYSPQASITASPRGVWLSRASAQSIVTGDQRSPKSSVTNRP